jgi:hypothetical protein
LPRAAFAARFVKDNIRLEMTSGLRAPVPPKFPDREVPSKGFTLPKS